MLWQKVLGASDTTAKPTVTFTNSYSDATDLTTYSFTSCDFSTASSTRYIVVAVNGRASSTVTVSSLTIGGVSATGYQNTSRLLPCSLWIAAVPTGTTGTVAVTFSGTALNCLIGVWAVYDISSATPTDNQAATTATTTASLTLSVQVDAVTVGCVTTNGANTATWTGVTENYDAQVESVMRSGGSVVETSTNATKTVQVDQSAAANAVLVAASWR